MICRNVNRGSLDEQIADFSMKMGKKLNLGSMPTDEMWLLHVEIGRLLSVRLTSEKRELEKRLAKLRSESVQPQTEVTFVGQNSPRQRRKYPRVLPKYQNPNEPSETWSGRGKQPRWLTAALKTGHTIDDFVIRNIEANKGKTRPQRFKVS
jgi:DNA-binding protein H-NS